MSPQEGSAVAASAPALTPAGGHALITGASSGLGRGCALELARCGVRVSLVSRSPDRLQELVSEIEAEGGIAAAFPADVTDAAALEEAIAAASAALGEVRICVNSAGVNRPGPTVDMALADWDQVVETNLRGTFVACRTVGRMMLAAGDGGRVINLSSQMGSVGFPGRAAYCASKHAVNGLTKALAVEWASAGVTVNAVAPTFIRTPMTEPMFADEEFLAETLRRIPVGTLGEIEDVTGAVLYLASDAARLVTGHILMVDGGWTAW